MFFREIKEDNHLSDAQKIAMQSLMASVLEGRDYSYERFDVVLKEFHSIMVKPLKSQVDSLVLEATGVISEFQKMLSARYGDIVDLEEESITILASNEDGTDSIGQLRMAFSRVKNLLEDDLRHLEDLITVDGLTQLTNRRGFDIFMKVVVDKWLSESRPLALALLDIDHFKRFNDEHGHRIGDQVLSVVGTHLKQALKDFDSSNNVMAARYGGEEFALVVSGPDAERLGAATHKCCSMVKKFNFLIRDADGNVVESGLHITLSAGVTAARPEWRGAYVENLIDNADRALYHAKKAGRDKIFEFRPQEENAFVPIKSND